jgi:hypothetical protein
MLFQHIIKAKKLLFPERSIDKKNVNRPIMPVSNNVCTVLSAIRRDVKREFSIIEIIIQTNITDRIHHGLILIE